MLQEYIELYIEYTPNITSSENNPRLCVYNSANLGHNLVKFNPKKTRKITLPIQIDSKKGIRPDSSITIQAFVDTVNSNYQPVGNEAGTLSIYLSQVLKTNENNKLKSDLLAFNAMNLINNDIDPSKGVVSIYCINKPIIKFESIKPHHYIGEDNISFIMNNISNYMTKCQEFYKAYRATYPQTESLRLPFHQYGSFYNIGASYSFNLAQKSSERFWKNLLNVTLKRHYQFMDLEECRATFLNRSNDVDRAVVLGKLLALPVNYCPYETDHVDLKKKSQSKGLFSKDYFKKYFSNNANGVVPNYFAKSIFSSSSNNKTKTEFDRVEIESFSTHFRCNYTKSGNKFVSKGSQSSITPAGLDCEDGSLEAGVLYMELINSDFLDPCLLKLKEVAEGYYYLQCLKGVSADAIGNANDNNNLGGHMDGMLVDRNLFVNINKRYSKLDAPFKGISNKLSDNVIPQYLPTLTIEGTGPSDPFGTDENGIKLQELKRNFMIKHANILGVLTTPFTYDRNEPHRFYKVVKSFQNFNFALDGFKVNEFILLNEKNGVYTSGVDYLDFLHSKPNISCVPMPELTEIELKCVKSVMQHYFPVVAFVEPKNTIDECKKNELLEKIVTFKNKCITKKSRENVIAVDFYLRYNEINEKLVNDLIGVIKSDNSVTDFTYHEEPISNFIGGYLLRFFVKKE